MSKLVFVFSVWLLVALAKAGLYADLDHQIAGAKTEAEARQVLMQHKDQLDSDLVNTLDGKTSLADLKGQIALRALAERSGSVVMVVPVDIQYQVKKEDTRRANWLSRALDHIGSLFKIDTPEKAPAIPSVAGALNWIQPLVYIVLILMAILLVGYAATIYVKGQQAKLKNAIIDEDEPDRSLDEWLALAESYEAQGEYRLAIRSLYVACLVRFDSAKVAAFVRGQTNWEHLKRITRSEKYSEDLQFTEATRLFDRVWYGYEVRGVDDVSTMKAAYKAVNSRYSESAA